MNACKIVTAALLLILSLQCAMAEVKGNASSGVGFQSVSGDFGRAWLMSNINTTSNVTLSNDLWSWGGVPRGWRLVNGVLVRDTNSTQTQIGSDWLGSTSDSLYTMAYNESSWIPPF
ncbi:hypothetical protein [Methanothrix sp.]|uniref:hypothetical protein n=1 Tax=Methanothrix sp. TaxID=90426 RepID=UPI003C720B57